MTVPLTPLTRKNMPWNWSNACQEAFVLLKRAFTSAPILHHFDPALPLIVETDASDYAIADYAIAGIFSLRTKDGDIHPVALYSHTLTGAELNYDTHDNYSLSMKPSKPDATISSRHTTRSTWLLIIKISSISLPRRC